MDQNNDKERLVGLTIVFAVILLFITLIAGFVWLFNPQTKTIQSDTNNDTQVNESRFAEYDGKYLSATLPEDWKIVEYENGEGSDMLTEGVVYKGLTGLSILTDNNQEVFKVTAVSGVGGLDLCTEVAKFSDTPQAYIDTIYTRTEEFNTISDPDEALPIVNDITTANYSAFTFGGYRVRRIGKTLYWNSKDNADTNVFNPLCGMNSDLLLLDGYTFSVGSDDNVTDTNIYQVKVVGTPNETTLTKLDGVLESLKTK